MQKVESVKNVVNVKLPQYEHITAILAPLACPLLLKMASGVRRTAFSVPLREHFFKDCNKLIFTELPNTQAVVKISFFRSCGKLKRFFRILEAFLPPFLAPYMGFSCPFSRFLAPLQIIFLKFYLLNNNSAIFAKNSANWNNFSSNFHCFYCSKWIFQLENGIFWAISPDFPAYWRDFEENCDRISTMEKKIFRFFFIRNSSGPKNLPPACPLLAPYSRTK